MHSVGPFFSRESVLVSAEANLKKLHIYFRETFNEYY